MVLNALIITILLCIHSHRLFGYILYKYSKRIASRLHLFLALCEILVSMFFPAQSHFKLVSAIYGNGFRSFALCCSQRGCIAFQKSLRKRLRTLLRTVSQQFLPWVSFFISFSPQIWMYSEICSSPPFTSG